MITSLRDFKETVDQLKCSKTADRYHLSEVGLQGGALKSRRCMLNEDTCTVIQLFFSFCL